MHWHFAGAGQPYGEKNIEVQRKAMNYYAMMHKEKDFTKFLEIYQKAMEYIESQIPQELKKHIG